MSTQTAVRFTLEPDNPSHLANLCGQLDEHLRMIEQRLRIRILNRGNNFQLVGDQQTADMVSSLIQDLYQEVTNGTELTPDMVHLCLQETDARLDAAQAAQPSSNPPSSDSNTSASSITEPSIMNASTTDSPQSVAEEAHAELAVPPASTDVADMADKTQASETGLSIQTRKTQVRSRGINQKAYIEKIQELDINFGIGPAGTGKTFLAVACAVEALEREEVRRILLVRPAVEAGEKLGFLPGDLSQKIDPYLRPLYDALYEMLGFDTVGRLIEKNVIEVAPLAYMRGRTLNHSFVILDESQNTTREQMKMFLTRIGFGSSAVITGDITQIDLPKGTQSGLKHAMQVLDGVPGIGFTHFSSKDVVRHPLVQRIVQAYDLFDQQQETAAQQRREEKARQAAQPNAQTQQHGQDG